MSQLIGGTRTDASHALPRAERALASLRRILVPTDGSPFAEHALGWGLEIAHHADAAIDLAFVNVLPPSVVLGELVVASRWEESAAGSALDYLEGLARSIRKTERVPLASIVLKDPSAARALTRHARNSHVDLIVMTTHGRKGAARVWLGSVAEGVIRDSPVPVLLLRPDESTRHVTRRGRLFSRLLVALDGSRNAEQALAFAAMLGALGGAHFRLLRVLDPITIASPLTVVDSTSPAEDALSQERERTSVYIAERVEWLRRRGLEADGSVAVDTNVAHVILDQAEREEADLLVVGTHGRKGMDRVLLGSVAEAVIRGTARGVLVVPRAWRGIDG